LILKGAKAMKSLSFPIVLLLVILAIGSNKTALAGQAAVPQIPPAPGSEPVEQDILFFTQATPGAILPSPPPMAGMRVFDQTVAFISAMDPGGNQAVTGAPYSADAVTETVQTLGDGNRIVKKVSSRVARDQEGRTRRDQSLDAIGPWVAAEGSPQVSFISDPVAKLQLILEPETRTARQMPLLDPANAVFFRGEARREVQAFETPVGQGVRTGVAARRMVVRNGESGYETRSESLGKQLIEGVEADGSRSITTIPAGAIGNERPIDIVSETWYAPSLKLVVLTRNSDPRFGETTYRLENLSLIEPVASLFEIPRDYTIVRPGGQPGERIIR
jgi:hypothetical protein